MPGHDVNYEYSEISTIQLKLGVPFNFDDRFLGVRGL
jgi:hypothetical protein